MQSIPAAHKCRTAILAALTQLGGEAQRTEIVALAERIGHFSHAERTSVAPPSKPQYATYLAYNLSWAITHLHKQGTIINVARGTWRLRNA